MKLLAHVIVAILFLAVMQYIFGDAYVFAAISRWRIA
jgi:hypothetical protein